MADDIRRGEGANEKELEGLTEVPRARPEVLPQGMEEEEGRVCSAAFARRSRDLSLRPSLAVLAFGGHSQRTISATRGVALAVPGSGSIGVGVGAGGYGGGGRGSKAAAAAKRRRR
jgi:hypothetical protein